LVCFSKLHVAQLLYSINALLCGGFPARVLLACNQLLVQLLLHLHCKSCLEIGAKRKLPQLKVHPILAALKPCAAHNLSQYKRAQHGENLALTWCLPFFVLQPGS
jgi:hypothetical protein